MRINKQKTEHINNLYNNEINAIGKKSGRKPIMGLEIKDALDGTEIFSNNGFWKVCKIEELNDMIRELTAMKEAIEEVTGIY